MHSLSGENDYDRSACSGDNVCDIFDDNEQSITINSIVWVSLNNEIWQGKVIRITYRNMESDAGNF